MELLKDNAKLTYLSSGFAPYSSTKEFITWFGPHLIFGCGGVGYDFLEKYLHRLGEVSKEPFELMLNMLRHFDVDEKILAVRGRRFEHLQRIFHKENMISLLSQPGIGEQLRQFEIPEASLQDTESGMSQSPLLADVLGMLSHDELEADVQRVLRQGFGACGALGRALSPQGFAIHPRWKIWVPFGSGGGVGPGLGPRVGAMLTRLKRAGAMPPVTIIALVPLASVYEIDEEKKSRAQAINHALFNSVIRRQNSHTYLIHRRRGDKIYTEELDGLFDTVITFGSGQDGEILSYNDIIEQMVELVWQTSFGGAGVEFLATLANEVRHPTLVDGEMHPSQEEDTIKFDGLLGSGVAVIEFPRERINDMMARRRSAELIEAYELNQADVQSEANVQFEEISDAMPNYGPSESFSAELRHRLDLMESAYRGDARLYQRMVGEMVGGSLTPVLEEERGALRQDVKQRVDEVGTKIEKWVTRSVLKRGMQKTVTRLEGRLKVVSEKERAINDEIQEINAEIEAQQAAGQQALTGINEIIRRYHWLPSFLLSTHLIFRVSILLGLITLGAVLGSFWNLLVLTLTVLLSAVPGIWLVLMRRLPPPETIEPRLYAYYHAYGRRIFIEERRVFWSEIAGQLQEHEQKLAKLLEDLRPQHVLLAEDWHNRRQRLLSPARHIQYLFVGEELETWYEEFLAEEAEVVLSDFWEACFNDGCENGVEVLVGQIKRRLNSYFRFSAQQRLLDLFGDRAVSGDETSVMNRVFTLAIRTGRLLHRNRYHRSFIVGMSNPKESKLAKLFRQRLKQHDLGIKFVENGDPYRITILGLEGGFDFSAVREASEMADHFEKHKHDPLIYPELRGKTT